LSKKQRALGVHANFSSRANETRPHRARPKRAAYESGGRDTQNGKIRKYCGRPPSAFGLRSEKQAVPSLNHLTQKVKHINGHPRCSPYNLQGTLTVAPFPSISSPMDEHALESGHASPSGSMEWRARAPPIGGDSHSGSSYSEQGGTLLPHSP
jgi:hypothetical protein